MGCVPGHARLGMSGRKGNTVEARLVTEGVLEEEQVKVGRTRKALLRLTPSAHRAFGLDKGKIEPRNRDSLAHEYWKRFYARRFSQKGYSVELEAPCGVGGRVDVLARKGLESVAIEVETGKSDVVSNVCNALRAKFTRVLVVATDRHALAKVERELAKTGLLLPGRINVLPAHRRARRRGYRVLPPSAGTSYLRSGRGSIVFPVAAPNLRSELVSKLEVRPTQNASLTPPS